MKRVWFSMAAGFAVYSCGAEIAVTWGDGFEKLSLREYCEGSGDGAELKHVSSGSRCLVIPKNSDENIKRYRMIELKKFPVNPMKKYVLTFTAWVEGPDTMENNPVLDEIFHDFRRNSKGKPLSGWFLRFYNEEGKNIPRLRPLFFEAVVHGTRNEYSETFYPPLGSVSASVCFTNNGNGANTMYIDEARMKEAPDEGALNINPEFKLGRRNYSGYSLSRNARLVELPDKPGIWGLDGRAKGVILLDPVPLKEGRRYRISCDLLAGEQMARLAVAFHDSSGKQIGQSKEKLRIAPEKEGTLTFEFIAVKDYAYAAPSIRNALIKGIRIIESDNNPEKGIIK